MARKTKEEALETRQRILDAAIDVFVSQGVTGASLEQIAERAGVTRGAVYWHFKNKFDIFEALHECLQGSVMDEVLAQLEKDHPDPLGQLQQLCIDWLINVAHDPVKKNILTIFYLKCDYSGDMADVLTQLNKKKCECMPVFTRFFDKAKQKGHIGIDQDPEVLTLALNCYLNGIKGEYLRNPEIFDMEKQAPLLLPLFFANLKS